MKKSTKNDLILIAAVLVIAFLLWVGMRISQGRTAENGVAVVTVDGEVYGRYALKQDVTEKIELADGSYNVLVIENGEADVTEASCPDKVCEEHRKVSKKNESIVCLPNKVIVTIENGMESDIDSETH